MMRSIPCWARQNEQDGKSIELEIASFPKWKRACELWSQPGWISRRVALAVEGRAENHARANDGDVFGSAHLTTDHH